jgi:hypothetical protein
LINNTAIINLLYVSSASNNCSSSLIHQQHPIPLHTALSTATMSSDKEQHENNPTAQEMEHSKYDSEKSVKRNPHPDFKSVESATLAGNSVTAPTTMAKASKRNM